MLSLDRTAICTNEAPQPIGPYSQAILVKPFIFLSGQIGLDPTTGNLVSDDLQAQTLQVFRNIEAVLSEANSRFSEIIKLTVFITDLSKFNLVNEIMKECLIPPYPARSTVEVSCLPKNAQIEIEVIAKIGC